MSEHFSSKDFTLGILGGGQLGRMLIQKAIDYNVSTAVMEVMDLKFMGTSTLKSCQ